MQNIHLYKHSFLIHAHMTVITLGDSGYDLMAECPLSSDGLSAQLEQIYSMRSYRKGLKSGGERLMLHLYLL